MTITAARHRAEPEHVPQHGPAGDAGRQGGEVRHHHARPVAQIRDDHHPGHGYEDEIAEIGQDLRELDYEHPPTQRNGRSPRRGLAWGGIAASLATAAGVVLMGLLAAAVAAGS